MIARTLPRIAFVTVLLIMLTAASAAFPAAAQETLASAIGVGEIKAGTINVAAPSARFFLNSSGPQSVVLQALATTPTLFPSLRVYDPSGIVIQSVDNNGSQPSVQTNVNLPVAGIYTIDISGANGTEGDFVISAQPGVPVPMPLGLILGQGVESGVHTAATAQVYIFDAAPQDVLLLTVSGMQPSPAPVVTLKDANTGETLAISSLRLGGARYRIPSGIGRYRVEVMHSGSPIEERYTVCLEPESGALPCAPAAPATPTQLSQPTQAPAQPTAAPTNVPVVPTHTPTLEPSATPTLTPTATNTPGGGGGGGVINPGVLTLIAPGGGGIVVDPGLMSTIDPSDQIVDPVLVTLVPGNLQINPNILIQIQPTPTPGS